MSITIKGILKTIAPTVAGLLPGPLGDMARKAVSDLLGIKPTSTEQEIETALAAANPDVLLKLKTLEADFKLKMEQLGVDVLKLQVSDTMDARAMEVATRSKVPTIISSVVVGGYLGVQLFLLFHAVPVENRDLLLRTMGTLDAALALVLGFWFGSSSSSRMKDATIQELSK